MSKTAVLPAVARLLPPLVVSARKGDFGKIGVIGGSLEYTGAPYYAAITACKLGVDLCHVFCAPEAAPVIKAYGPDFIVHPGLERNAVVEKLTSFRIDALVLGPGLGRDPQLESLVDAVLYWAAKSQKPIVIDADGLFFVGQRLPHVPPLHSAIITPNFREFERLCKRAIENVNGVSEDRLLASLASKLGATGPVDHAARVTDSGTLETVQVTDAGSLRRCGGQGDVLSGATAVFYLWAVRSGAASPSLAACEAASQLTRCAARRAFERVGRGVTTPDIISEIPSILKEIDGM